MKGFEPGTKCVVTFDPDAPEIVGEIVTCGARLGCASRSLRSGKVRFHTTQEILEWPGLYQPVDWMRPLDQDTDEDDMEIVNLYLNKPVTA